MDRAKLEGVVDSLRRRRDHPETPAPEALACQMALDRLRKKHGADAVDAILATVGELAIDFEDEWERLSIVHLAEWLGLSAWARPGEEKTVVLLTGPEELLAGFRDLWSVHRPVLEDLVLGAIGGYLYGALPRRPGEKRERAPESGEATALDKARTSDFEAALRLGARIGLSMQTGLAPGGGDDGRA